LAGRAGKFHGAIDAATPAGRLPKKFNKHPRTFHLRQKIFFPDIAG
jgi:hypothetical protein